MSCATPPRCQSCRYARAHGRATEMPWKGFQPRQCLAYQLAALLIPNTAALPRTHAGRVAVLGSFASNRISSLRTKASLPTVSSVAAPVASRVSSSTSRSRRTSAIVSPMCRSVSEFSRIEACLGEVGIEFAHFSRLHGEGGVRRPGIFGLDLNHGV